MEDKKINFQVLGNLVEITSKEKAHKSPLQIEHNRFVYFITVSAVIVAAITFFLGLILTNFSHVLSTFVNGFLIVLVAWVPQGKLKTTHRIPRTLNFRVAGDAHCTTVNRCPETCQVWDVPEKT